jgi:hypothetical protein
MAVLDSRLEFSDAQSLASLSASSAVVGDYNAELYNTTDPYAAPVNAWGTSITPDIGEGGVLEFNVSVDTALVGASADIDCKLVSKASSASISSGATTHATLNIPATSAAGYRKSVKVPAGTLYRYVGVTYIVATAGKTITSAKLNAWINLDHETHD